MDPAVISSIMSVLGPILTAFTGQQGKTGSTYGKPQLGLIDQIVNQVKGMGKGGGDITQNPTFQGGQQWLQGLFNDPEFFRSFEAPLMRQFNEEIIPGLANRFAGMGTGGSLGSTGFRNQLAREGSNLSTNIAALRGGMQQQAIPQALAYAQQPISNYQNLLNYALTPTQNVYTPGLLG